MFVLTLLACSSEAPAPAPAPAPVEKPAEAPAEAPKADNPLRTKASGLFGTLPADAATDERPIDAKRVALGRQLYFDTRLSKDDTISCNSCHQLARYGVDGEPTSPGVGGTRGGRNSPTVYNAALHFRQFWDGREPDVEAQAVGPILNPVEMAMPDGDAVVAKIGAIEGYKTSFDEVFEDGLTYTNIGVAIGAFERTLITPSPFDAWLGGDESALSKTELAGLGLFIDTGCASCHSGNLLGGNMYQKLGVVNAWEDDDMGRMEVTKNEADKQMFKVPSLRNIEKTGPYFHDGSVDDLAVAIQKMAHHQLGKELDAANTERIQAFLHTLTGKLDPEKVAPPTLP